MQLNIHNKISNYNYNNNNIYNNINLDLNLNLNFNINNPSSFLNNNNIFENFENKFQFDPNSRFFMIKSSNEDNIYVSIKYRIWCSSFSGNKKLNNAFLDSRNKDNYPIYLFFSVNNSGRIVGLCQMISTVNFNSSFEFWSNEKELKGYFSIVWLHIKDIPNDIFKSLNNGYNDNKSVIFSRNNQEIDPISGFKMMNIFKEYPLKSSILDDFLSYEYKHERKINKN
jgi:hypothetical protein